jgi:protein-tyrosine phosphatase
VDWITDEIAIGNGLEAQDTTLLKQHAFRSVLSLDGTLTPERAGDLGLVEVASYRLIDGAGNDMRLLRWAIQDLCRLAEEQAPVLVHCHAGRSRSVIVVAGYLMQVRGMEPEDALAAIADRREINVTPALLELFDKLER